MRVVVHVGRLERESQGEMQSGHYGVRSLLRAAAGICLS